jgi:hypothetical protein
VHVFVLKYCTPGSKQDKFNGFFNIASCVLQSRPLPLSQNSKKHVTKCFLADLTLKQDDASLSSTFCHKIPTQKLLTFAKRAKEARNPTGVLNRGALTWYFKFGPLSGITQGK